MKKKSNLENYKLKEVYNFLENISNNVGEVITEYHWREACGLMEMIKDTPTPPQTTNVELDCPFDFTSRCTLGRCDCKPKNN